MQISISRQNIQAVVFDWSICVSEHEDGVVPVKQCALDGLYAGRLGAEYQPLRLIQFILRTSIYQQRGRQVRLETVA